MSTNGRRAWRRWMRRVENNPKLRPPGKSISRLAREGKRHLGIIPPTIAKPITARSLVGMSQGARKRAAQSAAVDELGEDRAHAYSREYGSYLRSGEYLGAYWTARETYRIGERLRPCPGCKECEHGKCWRCDNCGTTKGLCDLALAAVRCECCKGYGQWRISYPATIVCDGSGVLPARKSK